MAGTSTSPGQSQKESFKEKILQNARSRAKLQGVFENFDDEVIPKLIEVPFYHEEKNLSGPNGKYEDLQQKTGPQDLSTHLSGFMSGHISFIGPAGSGKSAVMKRIAQNVIDGKYESLNEVEIVHFIDCEEFCGDMSSSDCLFQSTELSTREKNDFIKFAKDSPHKVLFVIDSLDTLPFNSDQENAGIETQEKQASPVKILWNLLSKQFLPGCRIITSSRGFAIRQYKGPLRPEKILRLGCLTLESVQQIIAGFLGEDKVHDTLDFFESSNITSLCVSPMFLAFTLIGLKTGHDFKPSTMSGIVNHLLQSLMRSPHFRASEVIKKFTSLAYFGTSRNKFFFSLNELKKCGLSETEASDFARISPAGMLPILKRGGHHLFCFSHQLVHTALTAFHVADMDLKEFNSFVDTNLHTPRFTMIRRILCGILLDGEILEASYPLLDVKKDLEKKKSILRKSIGHMLETYTSGPNEMNFYALLEIIFSLYEAKDGMDDILKSVHSSFIRLYDLHGVNFLSSSDVHVVGSVIARFSSLNHVALNVQPNSLKIFHNCIKNCKIQISSLKIRGLGDGFLSPVDMKYIAAIAKHCKVKELDLDECIPESEYLQLLNKNLGDYKLKHLDISYSKRIDSASKMVNENEYKSFPIKLVPVKESVAEDARMLLPPLDMIRFGIQFVIRGFWKKAPYQLVYAVACLLQNVTEKIYLYGWKIEERHKIELKKRLNSSHQTGLKILLAKNDILSYKEQSHTYIGTGPFVSQSAQLSLKNSGPFFMPYSPVAEDQKLNTKKTLTGGPERNVTDLNPVVTKSKDSQGPEDFESPISIITNIKIAHDDLTEERINTLSSFLKLHRRILDLELRGCFMTSESLGVLQDAVTGYKIIRFAVSATENIGEYLPAICLITKTCEAEFLSLEENDLTDDSLDMLKKTLVDSKINNLKGMDFSYNEDISDFLLLAQVLQCVGVSQLNLSNCSLDDEKLSCLGSQLKSKITSLNISNNANITEKGYKSLAGMLHPAEVTSLNISGCDVSDVEIAVFRKSLPSNVKIAEFDMSYNEALEENDMKSLGLMVKQLEVKDLHLAGCNLNKDLVTSLKTSLEGYKLDIFDISDNMSIGFGTGEVAEFVKQCSVKNLDMSECMLNVKQIRDFTSSLADYEISKLNLNERERTVDVEHFSVIADLIPFVQKELVVCFKDIDDGFKRILCGKDGLKITFEERNDTAWF